MATTIAPVRDSIEAFVKAQFPGQSVYRTGVPTLETLVTVQGRVDPYLVLDFTDIAWGGSSSFAGVRWDEYSQPFRIYYVAPSNKLAESLQIKGNEQIIGAQFEYTGQVTPVRGGNQYVMINASGAAVAWIASSSFTVSIGQFDII